MLFERTFFLPREICWFLIINSFNFPLYSKSLLVDKPSMFKKVEREIAVMKVLDHPHVMKLIDVYETKDLLFVP